MEKPRGFNSKIFLFRLLALIFFVQVFAIIFSFTKCVEIASKQESTPTEVCPNLGDNFQKTTNTMIATVLSLLVPTGNSNP